MLLLLYYCFFFFQAEDGIRDVAVTGVQTCALPICRPAPLVDPSSHVPPLRNAGTPSGEGSVQLEVAASAASSASGISERRRAMRFSKSMMSLYQATA